MVKVALLVGVLSSLSIGWGTESKDPAQQTLPVCPANASESTDCAKVSTGCVCVVLGGYSTHSKDNCGGCRFVYTYEWSCTNPFQEGDADGTLNPGCNTPQTTLNFGTCLCDGTALVTLTYSCGACPQN